MRKGSLKLLMSKTLAADLPFDIEDFFALADGHPALSGFDDEFLEDLKPRWLKKGYATTLSDKQVSTLDRIYRKMYK